MKRAMRCDKVTLAALEAVLILYENPDRLTERLPTLRLLTRDTQDIRAQAERILPALMKAVDGHAEADIWWPSPVRSAAARCRSTCCRAPRCALTPRATKKRQGEALKRISAAFRALPCPVIGRVHDGALLFDLRCLDDETAFVAQLERLDLA